MSAAFDPARVSARLWPAREGGPRVDAGVLQVPDAAAAYAVQDATQAKLGPIGGWKVGAKRPDAEPTAAPLAASGLLPSGAAPNLPATALRGVEVEVALVLGQDLLPQGRWLPPAELAAAIARVVPALELVDTRLADWFASDPWAQLADLQGHGGLVTGRAAGIEPAALHLAEVRAQLWYGDTLVVDRTGGHPAPDVWRLLAWMALHAESRGQPLRAGQVVTTGSCTGLNFALPGTRVRGVLHGLGEVELQF